MILNKITKEELERRIGSHKKWLNGEEGGEKLVLINYDLHGADLRGADLHGVDLHGADLHDVDLRGADLYFANLHGVDLHGVDLRSANLYGANLHGVDLHGVDLHGANLRGANLYGVDLHGAELYGADLRGAKGLISNEEYMNKNFSQEGIGEDQGWIVYKKIGEDTPHKIPKRWKIKENSILIEEDLNRDRKNDCGSGVNVGTKGWCEDHYEESDLWKCKIYKSDIEDVIVPYSTNGKVRCRRLMLLERI